MLTVTEEAKEILRDYECPEGTVLRLDSVNGHHQHDGFHVRIGAGWAQGDDQLVEYEGEDLLRIARHVSEELNGSTVDVVETLEGPAVGLSHHRPPAPRHSRTVRRRTRPGRPTTSQCGTGPVDRSLWTPQRRLTRR